MLNTKQTVVAHEAATKATQYPRLPEGLDYCSCFICILCTLLTLSKILLKFCPSMESKKVSTKYLRPRSEKKAISFSFLRSKLHMTVAIITAVEGTGIKVLDSGKNGGRTHTPYGLP